MGITEHLNAFATKLGMEDKQKQGRTIPRDFCKAGGAPVKHYWCTSDTLLTLLVDNKHAAEPSYKTWSSQDWDVLMFLPIRP